MLVVTGECTRLHIESTTLLSLAVIVCIWKGTSIDNEQALQPLPSLFITLCWLSSVPPHRETGYDYFQTVLSHKTMSIRVAIIMCRGVMSDWFTPVLQMTYARYIDIYLYTLESVSLALLTCNYFICCYVFMVFFNFF